MGLWKPSVDVVIFVVLIQLHTAFPLRVQRRVVWISAWSVCSGVFALPGQWFRVCLVQRESLFVFVCVKGADGESVGLWFAFVRELIEILRPLISLCGPSHLISEDCKRWDDWRWSVFYQLLSTFSITSVECANEQENRLFTPLSLICLPSFNHFCHDQIGPDPGRNLETLI